MNKSRGHKNRIQGYFTDEQVAKIASIQKEKDCSDAAALRFIVDQFAINQLIDEKGKK